jgi:hypothetical protein
MPLLGVEGVQLLGQHVMAGVLDGSIQPRKAAAASDLLNRVLLPAAVARVRPEPPGRQLARLTLQHKGRLMQIEVGDEDLLEPAKLIVDEQGRTVQ